MLNSSLMSIENLRNNFANIKEEFIGLAKKWGNTPEFEKRYIEKLLVEQVFNTCLVPYERPMKERMKIFYELFLSVNDCAISLRDNVKKIIEIIQLVPDPSKKSVKIKALSRELLYREKAVEHIEKFCVKMEQDNKLRNMMITLLGGSLTSSECKARIGDILQTLGEPVYTNLYYVIIKQLLEKIVPVWIDKEGVEYVVSLVKDSMSGDPAKEPKIICRGMELILVLSFGFPHFFAAEQLCKDMLGILCKSNSDEIVPVLQALSNVITDVKKYFPHVCGKIIPLLKQLVKLGSKKQAKYAIKLIFHIVDDKQEVFGELIQHLKEHFTYDSQYFKTALASVGYIAFLCHDMFATEFKNVVAKVVVKDLLMLDKVRHYSY
ncbi:sister chromatid cohesion protein PDS5 homolog B [Trichonephila clavipes]|nr:sister chromatid cohesion protein PDS5 homolog B [Trichonephila clavipes]